MEYSACGIDVSKDTLDVSVMIRGKPLARQFANTREGYRELVGWLKHRKVAPVHAQGNRI